MEHATARIALASSLCLALSEQALASKLHPVCKALRNRGQPIGTFPEIYVCHHAEEAMICSKRGGGDASGLSVAGGLEGGAAPAGFKQIPPMEKVCLLRCEKSKSNIKIEL